jgi:hypothetical protein
MVKEKANLKQVVPSLLVAGVVHANVGQKLVKRNKITSFPDVRS